MKRAAVDARTAYPALVIVDDTGDKPILVLARTIGLAEYEDLPPERQRPGHDKRRIITAGRIAERVKMMVDLLLEQNVEHLSIEAPGRAEFSGRFCDALRDVAKEAGIAVERVDTHWPLSNVRERPEEVRGAIVGWPSEQPAEDLPEGWRTGDYKGTRDAARVLLGALGVETELVEELAESVRTVVPRSAESPVIVGPSLVGIPSVGWTSIGWSTVGTPEGWAPVRRGREVAVLEADEEQEEEIEDSGRPRVLGLDPGYGSRAPGVIVAEAVAPEVATQAPIIFRVVKRPRLTVDPLDAKSRAAFLVELVRLIREYRVSRVVIERISSVHAGHAKGRDAARALGAILGQATGAIQSNWLGGMLEGACLAAFPPEGFTVRTVPEVTWRAKVVGKAHAKNADVTPIVHERFVNWPARSTVDQRDAAGIILWDEIDSRPAAVTVQRRKRKPGMSEHAGRTERRAAARAAAGCTCGAEVKGGHRKGCPGRKPRTAKGPQLCSVCKQPRKGHTCSGAEPPEDRPHG